MSAVYACREDVRTLVSAGYTSDSFKEISAVSICVNNFK